MSMKGNAIAMGVIGLCTAIAAAQPHSGDLWLATSAGGELKLSPRGFVPDGTPDAVVLLAPAGGPLFYGWSSNNPGFDDIETPDPENDCYPFEPGAKLSLEVVEMDPALIAWDVQFHAYYQPGDRAYLGGSPGGIHTHLIWHINSKHPDFEQLYGLKVHWRGLFRLVDTGSTGYDPSQPFPMIFAIADCQTGDINDDGNVDFGDINPFIRVLGGPADATVEERCAADIDLDGWVDFGDINPFIRLFTT